MSKSTIFGEENFIDNEMIRLEYQRAVDNFIYDEMLNVIHGSISIPMPKVSIDKEKLRKWVVLCMKLENIEHSELIDMATKKRITDLEARLAEKEKEIISLECVISEIHNDIKELHEFKVGECEYDLTDEDARYSLECELLNKDQEKIELLEKLRGYYCKMMWDGRGVNEAFVIQECVDLLDKELNKLQEKK